MRKRYRQCEQSAHTLVSLTCNGTYRQVENCNVRRLSKFFHSFKIALLIKILSYDQFYDQTYIVCPIDGGWSAWSKWSECDLTLCDTKSYQIRKRYCNNPSPAFNGKMCFGSGEELIGIRNLSFFSVEFLSILHFKISTTTTTKNVQIKRVSLI
jgi:hypothetical protein